MELRRVDLRTLSDRGKLGGMANVSKRLCLSSSWFVVGIVKSCWAHSASKLEFSLVVSSCSLLVLQI